MIHELFAESYVQDGSIKRPTIIITEAITPDIHRIISRNKLKLNTDVEAYGAEKVVSREVGCCSKHRITEVTRIFTDLSAIRKVLSSNPSKIHERQSGQFINVIVTEETTSEFLKRLSDIFIETLTFNTIVTTLAGRDTKYAMLGNLFSIEANDLIERERTIQPQDVLKEYHAKHEKEFYEVALAIFQHAVPREHEVHPYSRKEPRGMSIWTGPTVLDADKLLSKSAIKIIKAVNFVYRSATHINLTKEIAKSIAFTILKRQQAATTNTKEKSATIYGAVSAATIECNLRISRDIDLDTAVHFGMVDYLQLLDSNGVTVEEHVEILANPYMFDGYLMGARLASRYYDDTKESLERHHLCALLLTIQRTGTVVSSLVQKEEGELTNAKSTGGSGPMLN